MKQNDEIRDLFAKASIGQDVTNISVSFETEAEADEAFAYICWLGDDSMPTKEKILKGSDWVLIWSWAAFLLLVGPFLISARDSLMVFVGFGIFAALIYFTQRRVIPIIQEKIK